MIYRIIVIQNRKNDYYVKIATEGKRIERRNGIESVVLADNFNL